MLHLNKMSPYLRCGLKHSFSVSKEQANYLTDPVFNLFRKQQLVGQSGLVVCFTLAIQIPPSTIGIKNMLFHGQFQSPHLLSPLYASLPFTNKTLELKSSL